MTEPVAMPGSLTPERFTDREVLARRGSRAVVDPWRANAAFIERELSARGTVDEVAVLLLANRECPFRCVFCDLWKQTTVETVPRGAVPRQIELALQSLAGQPRHIKLYNSGNFFDRKAIPPADLPAIAALLRDFETVIVENHPLLCGDDCLRFRDMLPQGVALEVALGLETVHPRILPRLNKRMTIEDFARACEFLLTHGLQVRSFVLSHPPWMPDSGAIDWAVQSVAFARSQGARVVSVIPTRGDDGVLRELQARGEFPPPTLADLEDIQTRTVCQQNGRLLIDLWEARRFATCATCLDERLARLERINHTQQLEAPVHCHCSPGAHST